MPNKITKNLEKTGQAGIITVIATVGAYTICYFLKTKNDELLTASVVVISALLSGVYNYIKHGALKWPWASK